MPLKKSPFARSLFFIFAVHLTGLALLTLMRIVFYIAMRPTLPAETAGDVALAAQAFLRGVWFDNVVACYVVAPMLLAVGIGGLLGYSGRKWLTAWAVYAAVMYLPLFAAGAANVPYFLYFNQVINASVFNYTAYAGTTAGMIFGEASYIPYIILFFACAAAFAALCIVYARKISAVKGKNKSTIATASLSILTLMLLCAACFLGIRGRLGYNPIKVSAAYFCDNAAMNQMGLNAAFNVLNSALDELRPENRRLALVPDDEALRYAADYLLEGEAQPLKDVSPIACRIEPEGKPTGQNVVVVLMESMSANLMGTFGNTLRLTPALDSLCRNGLLFENCYSSGNHTNHGIYATLYSRPSIMFRNAMKGSVVKRVDGLPTVLRDNGYETLFFMTHEAQYDNMNAFFRTSGFSEVYAQEDYPRSARVNHFGVPDDFLFTYALPVLRRKAAAGKPFFATLLTISNHPPYVVPDDLKSQHKEKDLQIVEYADRSIARFMAAAKKEPWYANTIFVFLGDHGKMWGESRLEVSESMNHIPLLFYGAGIKPERRTDPCGQIDVAPTLLSMLSLPYVKNNFGIDLTRRRRNAIFYSADKVLMARDSTHLYIYTPEAARESFYYISNAGVMPKNDSVPAAPYEHLKQLVFNMLQAAENF